MAAWRNKPWVLVLASLLAFLVSFSRLYLGVHFVSDIVVGWLLGYMVLLAFLRFWDPVARWLERGTLPQQILIPFSISLVMVVIGFALTARLDGYVFPPEWADNTRRAGPLPDPVSLEDTFTIAGMFLGLATGMAWMASRGGYQTSSSL